MLNLSEITIYYIGNTFTPEQQKNIYTSFSLLEAFGLKFYEDKYIDLIQRSSDITSDTKRDMFMYLLEKDIEKIIEEHFIYLNKDIAPSLYEVNEIVNFLYIVQNLEDYQYVSYRINAQDSPRNIVVDLIEYFTLLEKPRIMEIISSVGDYFIDAMKNYIEDREETQEEVVDTKHFRHVKSFFDFIENTACLGLKYFNSGYTSITLEELNNLISENIPEYIDRTILTNQAQAALDCLSILIICKDSYELPVLKFKQNTSLFTEKLENATKLQASMLSMLNDFYVYLEAKKQQEALNAA